MHRVLPTLACLLSLVASAQDSPDDIKEEALMGLHPDLKPQNE